MRLPELNSSALKRNGPLPVASRICWNGSVRATRSGMTKQTGLVGLASPFTSIGKGRLRRKRRRRSSTASKLSVTVSSFWPVGLRFIQRRMEATQSAARTGSPS
jgi:hypothetical protein